LRHLEAKYEPSVFDKCDASRTKYEPSDSAVNDIFKPSPFLNAYNIWKANDVYDFSQSTCEDCDHTNVDGNDSQATYQSSVSQIVIETCPSV
jgi:hypothetical protein